jgi:hypothetical protein
MRVRSFVAAMLFLCSSVCFAQITFTASRVSTTGAGFAVSGDFNRDGIPDLAVAQGGNTINILLGHANGTYTSFSTVAVDGDITQIAMADVNHDGNLDLVLNSLGNELQFLLGNGDGTFRHGSNLLLSFEAGALAVGDFNRDGFVDIATHECQTVQNPACVVNVYLNDGTGHFNLSASITPVSASSGNANAESLAVIDANGDGNQDLAFLDTDGFEIAFGDGTGGFSTPIFKAVTNPDNIQTGSFNHDSKLDLAIRTTDDCIGCSQPTTHVAVYQNDGTGHFGLRSRLLMGSTDSFGVAQAALFVTDVNGDGISDLVTTSDNTGLIQYALGHGDGTFAAPVQLTRITNAIWTAARDLNRDGRHDLIVSSGSEGLFILKNTNATVNCTPPSAATREVHLCSPLANQTVARTFTVSASGNSPAGISRVELWIDGKKRTEALGDQLRASVTVTAGRHRIAVVIVDTNGTATHAVSVTAK